MTPDNPREERLARLIAATRAKADPAVLARARARIAARDSARSRAPGLALWLARPATLAGAGALFALCVAGAFALGSRTTVAASETSLISAVYGEEDLGLPIDESAAATNGAAPGDSGEVTP